MFGERIESMDLERVRIAGEVALVRLRTYLHVAVRSIGIAIVLLVMWNVFGAAVTGSRPLAPYRPIAIEFLGVSPYSALVADLVALAIGLVLARWG
jgi:hypothetical protein